MDVSIPEVRLSKVFRHRRTLVVRSLFLLLVTAAVSLAEPLVYQGKTVHPGCIYELTPEVADTHPINAAVDLEGCHDSNRHCGDFTEEKGVITYRDEALFDQGYFAYESVGRTKNGIDVVHIYHNSGGSGMFQVLLMLRFEKQRIMQNNEMRERTLLKALGHHVLENAFRGHIRILGDKVVIKADQGTSAILDLSAL